MTLEDIKDAFEDNDHQKQTICCTIKELLSNNHQNPQCFLKQDIVYFLGSVLMTFDANYQPDAG
jgi:hypothetical protein